MRLLYLDSHGTPFLEKFSGDKIPPYATLSHTWGPAGSEVTYEDVSKGTARRKASYDKIRFCGEKAASHGLKYFWVDTCCIDKSSSAELQYAITSMFRWFRDAARCYVYLSDVSSNDCDLHSQFSQFPWESAFRGSRWFTRGWTLQELLAPASVEFFSREGSRLGDKRTLDRQIHEITGIAIPALRGTPLTQFSVDERFKWAENRQTTVKEDRAYCLLGIFNVYLPLIYGEGDNAFSRLEEEIQKSSKDKGTSVKREQFAELNFTYGYSDKATHHAWIVPFEKNPRFTGRKPQLTKLEEMLFQQDQTTKIAIIGLGGVGKTQLALELVYRIRYENCSIIWIPATNRESLEQAYLDAAKQLGISGCEDDKVDVKRLVQNHLSSESAGQWLLVFDNADDINMWIGKSEQGSSCLIDYLPKNKQGSIIFTTRDKKTAVKLAHQNVVGVPEMDETVATQLLQKCLVDQNLINNREDTTALLAQLTYLPLAIVQAAAYINENEIALRDYLSLLAEQEEDVIDLLSEEFEDEGRYRNVKNPVATTWLISFEQIRQRDPLAADYLSFMSCIDPKDVPQLLLPPGQSRKKETDAIGMLNAYSFIIKRPADQAADIHRLVHLATRNWLRKEELLAQWTEKVIVRLEEVFPDDDYRNRSVWRTYLPHARYALESDLVDRDWKNRMDLMWRYGMCLYEDGRWNEAETPITQVQVMETRKRVFGTEHPDTLTSMANLASTYMHQGRWKEAEELEVQVMETSLRVLGAEHPDTLTSMANLASTYRKQGRWKEAEELEVQVMETSLKVLGAEHPDTLTSMANLASTYRNQGRWKEAEELEVQAMETRKRVLGAEHPDTLTSMNNLAFTWKKEGRVAEAIKLINECVQLRTLVLGADHPNTLSSSTALTRWKIERLQVVDRSLTTSYA
ncbi:HET-domain-containing protein [Zopfia rhizophila CBS 207.26]|uniref:HET-domain-containing protein n=1 Tax=Zopfia rhizophila CBS 207.26 TaxID=1314779 RepID=A0A6A6ETQ5_9PEZI|nr:HET-domain-containing protein [Zopfia rhizophila CBS 207.26]